MRYEVTGDQLYKVNFFIFFGFFPFKFKPQINYEAYDWGMWLKVAHSSNGHSFLHIFFMHRNLIFLLYNSRLKGETTLSIIGNL